ncbi:sigma-54 dependent transcriptional regulator [uncultured Dokdonia sp.]|uniref:sigma-54-dependent transcriptional regulator n=1 Tax=uncultured Dokdonia sp. TaxID=575653 RepID=UPI0026257551|nr:sigma-54 dependent transcriptional regulator [uncultured Dokdonia sp.]
MGKILIVEDEFIIAQDLRRIVSGLGHAVMGMAKSADEAMKKIANEPPDLVLLDIHIIGDLRGTELAVKIREEFGLPFIYVTSYSDSGTLSEMTRTNPLGYILKPFDERDIRVALDLGFRKIDTDNTPLPTKTSEGKATANNSGISTVYIPDIIGESDAIAKTLKQVQQVAFTDITVLIQGETGTGKELIMEALHKSSPRKKKSLVKVNCAALPSDLIESVLFGHEKGSFTGATEKRIGKFEQANGGTLFLDEIGELPLNSQSKLLRCIQEKEIETVGGIISKKIDVRIIAATNRNLEEEVEKGTFRADLFFRLSIFPISVPPLRERGKDIELLANYFMNRFSKEINRPCPELDKETLRGIMQHEWPGNVRELQHFIERGILLAEDDILFNSLDNNDAKGPDNLQKEFELKSLQDVEREQIIQTLKYCKGKVRGKGGAAEILKLHPSTLDFRIKKLDIKKENEYT